MELSFPSLLPDTSMDSITDVYQHRYLLLNVLVTKVKKEEQYMIVEILELLVFYPLLDKCWSPQILKNTTRVYDSYKNDFAQAGSHKYRRSYYVLKSSPKIPIWLKFTFSTSIWLKMMKKWDKIAFLQISAVSGTR